jgi:hypothetical protein
LIKCLTLKFAIQLEFSNLTEVAKLNQLDTFYSTQSTKKNFPLPSSALHENEEPLISLLITQLMD